MATESFVPGVKIGTNDDIVPASFGSAANQGWGVADVGKAVKLHSSGNYVLAAKNDPAGDPVVASDDIEAVIVSVEAFTVNGGYGFGSIKRNNRVEARVATGSAQFTIGAYAVADDQAAIGTANTGNRPLVRSATGVNYKWRCIAILSGTGVAGDVVLLERV